MKIRMLLWASVVVVGIAMVAAQTATAQSMQGGMGAGMMQGGTDQGADHGKNEGGMGGGMTCPMMRGDGMGGGMMGGGMMGRGMTERGMMGSGMMGSGGAQGGMGALFGSRVRPVMNLSAGDVRSYLTSRLDQINNKRLKLGDVKSDNGTIIADIVTVDNSLVQQLKVDPHTGAITYEN